MKIAVLGDPRPGYIRPMMDGLLRMLAALDCEAVPLWNGIRLLSDTGGMKGAVKNALFRFYLARVADCDAVVIVQHLVDAFRTTLKVEALRKLFPDKPVLLYDLVYLPTVGRWGPWLMPSGPQIWGTPGHSCRGMNRYDWYLCASAHNRLPMPGGAQPCTQIGLHLDDGSLFPDQNGKFRALVDFEREAFPHERKIQIEALEETGTDYTVLQGQYAIEDIRAVYRTCSLYFIAHMESFGVPICELQACDCRIMTPYAGWCDAHRLPGEACAGNGGLPPNFIVYDSDKEKLVQAIRELRQKSDPHEAVNSFKKNHGHFLTGNLSALQNVLEKIRQGKITARSHLDYDQLTAQIPPRPVEPCDEEKPT